VRPHPRGTLFVERHLREVPGGFEIATYVRPRAGISPGRLQRALMRESPRARVTGYPLLEAEVRQLLPADLLRVGSFSLLLVALTLLLHFRRLAPALVAVASVGTGVVWLLLGCAVLGIPWTAYNLIVIPVLIGIAIDENVFLVHGALERSGTAQERVARALRESGRAVLTTAMTTAAGFATLSVCAFDGLRSLGTTAALGIATCLAATLVVTPALLPWLSPRTARGPDRPRP
jgi:predicted RND superfamily exporter protein